MSCSATGSTGSWPRTWPSRRCGGRGRRRSGCGFDTQSMPARTRSRRRSSSLVSVNACFYVKTWRSNDGFLGDGSFAAGIRATELRPGRDRGTSLVTGVSDAQFELLRWYFVEVDDDTGFDAAAEADRPRGRPGRAGHARRGRPPGARDRGPGPARRPGRGARPGAGQAPRRGRAAARRWPRRGRRTQKLTAAQLRKQLAGAGRAGRELQSGTPWLDPAEVHRVIAEAVDRGPGRGRVSDDSHYPRNRVWGRPAGPEITGPSTGSLASLPQVSGHVRPPGRGR